MTTGKSCKVRRCIQAAKWTIAPQCNNMDDSLTMSLSNEDIAACASACWRLTPWSTEKIVNVYYSLFLSIN